jgi:hypothetical protein
MTPLHKNFLVILVRVFVTHAGSRNACMQCIGITLRTELVRMTLLAGERCFSAQPSCRCCNPEMSGR